MNYRITITLCISLVFAIIVVLYVCGCGSASTGRENNNTIQKNSEITPEQRQVEWQKMKKWRSVHGGWIEDISVRSSEKPAGIGEPGQSRHIRILTLSEQQLVLLDWHSSNSSGARVKNKRILPGRGVEFDIYFPGNNPGSCSLDFVSSGEGGSGSLVGTDISGYGAIALKFTLVSVNGQSGPELKQKLIAGVVIGPTDTGRLSTYEPVTLGMSNSEKTVIAKTYTSTDKIYEVGFHVHMLNPQDWDASGSMITLRVESAVNGGNTPK
ncbi:MAG TPA: hypothetical protein DIU00_06395 [Phycisphaerales bacterium]|nr:hypothetical protein [Phycisphaerales bacterium]